MKIIARASLAALLVLAVAAPPALAEEHRARQSPGFEQDMKTKGADEQYGAFIHFASGEHVDHERVLTQLDLGAGMWFDTIDAVYAYGRVGAFRALIEHPLVLYLEDLQELTPTGDTAVWSTRARVAQTRAQGGPFRAPNGAVLDGTGVGVAVVDTGVDGTHPDLAGRMAGNFKIVCSTPVLQNTSTNECFGPVVYQAVPDSDSAGHGTHVAGIVAGDGTASQGTFKGVAPGAKLYGFSWFEGASVGSLQSAAAFRWVLDNGATADPPVRVVTNSWGCVGGCVYDPMNINNRLANQLVDRGVTVLFAAGNDGGTGASNVLSGYAKNPKPGVIGVAGSFDDDLGERDGTMYADSSRAQNTSADAVNYPDVSAPGQFITSTCTHRKPDCEAGAWIEWPEFYSNLTGTSMATPHVAGAVALLYQNNPAITPAIAEDVILDTALKVAPTVDAPGAYIPDPQNSGGTTSFDKGAGLLDVPAMLTDPRVAAPKDGTGFAGPPALTIDVPAVDGSSPSPVTISGTAADGRIALDAPVTLATDPDDYDGPGAAELRELVMTDTPGALSVGLRVEDAADRFPNGTIRYVVAYKIDGQQKSTSVDLLAAGVSNPAQNTGTNTHRASSVTLNAATDTITFTVSHATLGDPVANAPIHNIQAFVQAGAGVIVIQDTMPGGVADNLGHPRYADPFTIKQVAAPSPAVSVSVSLDGGTPTAATIGGSGPYTWSADLGGVAPGPHSVVATLRLRGVERAIITRDFDVVLGNQPPVLDPIANRSVVEMDTLVVDVSAADPDDDESDLAFSSGTLPAGATLTSTGAGAARLTWRPRSTDAGTYPVTITVQDPGAKSDSQTVTITVTDGVPRAIGAGGLEYRSIQDAITAATSGDTVMVLPGTHVASLVLDDTITLCGTLSGTVCVDDRAAAGGVILQPSGSAPVVRVTASGASIQGLTFDSFEIAISAEAPALIVQHVRFARGRHGLVVGAVDGTLMRTSVCTGQTVVCAAFGPSVAGRAIDARMNDWSVYVDALVARRMDRGAGTILYRPYLTG